MNSDTALRAVDLLVVLKLAAHRGVTISVRQLEDGLGVPKSTVAQSIRRLRDHGLVKADEHGRRRINLLALRELLEHGIRWVAPAKVGDFELGLPTAHSAEVLAKKLSADADPLVLPLPHGPVRGRAVTPIHPKAAEAAQKDPDLLRLLAIVDALRIGRARDREVASAELRACL